MQTIRITVELQDTPPPINLEEVDYSMEHEQELRQLAFDFVHYVDTLGGQEEDFYFYTDIT